MRLQNCKLCNDNGQIESQIKTNMHQRKKKKKNIRQKQKHKNSIFNIIKRKRAENTRVLCTRAAQNNRNRKTETTALSRSIRLTCSIHMKYTKSFTLSVTTLSHIRELANNTNIFFCLFVKTMLD